MILLVGSIKIANWFFDAGIELLDQGLIVNGHRAFRFNVKAGQEAIVQRILRGTASNQSRS